MNRRSFLQSSAVGSTVGILAPQLVLATPASQPTFADLAGGVFYTQEAPGRWSQKVAGHLPRIETESSGDKGLKVRVITGHEMKDYEHYIVKHVLLDQNFKFLKEHLFNPLEDKAPISEFELTDYSGTLYALSVCNQHDTWLNQIEI